ncbi:DUF4845 domain-containing protein [Salinisphaera sp.]|uniref:DUF4845 domain-containing protein n=1 Tax=Salinisphaera sp. TaxID=1914330 RepID=UPI002D77D29C|nr:DUF4845 domain-containing protein [Salinisphaera sp.]HET7314861.1 DUF4845 domain-containing protein [Salinisphaera sp.]
MSDRPRTVGAAARQGGFTLWSALYVLITFGIIVFVAVRSVPVYLNNFEIQKALAAVANDPSMQHADIMAIQRAVGRHFEAGYTSGVSPRDVTIGHAGAARVIELRYEVRRPLAFNMSLVYSFKDTARMTGGGPGD